MTELLAQTTPIIAGTSSPIIWAFIFIGIALILFFIELFVPSGGLLALVGGLAVIGSLVAFFMHDANTGLIATAIYIVFGPVLFWIAFKIWASSPLAKRMILGGVVEEDSEEAMQKSQARFTARQEELQQLIGKEGSTITVLRPIGVVRIDGQRIDAMAETGSIEANTAVKVVSAYDNQIKVKAISD
jgi:membrane-bound serine protease (ClpP class)